MSQKESWLGVLKAHVPPVLGLLALLYAGFVLWANVDQASPVFITLLTILGFIGLTILFAYIVALASRRRLKKLIKAEEEFMSFDVQSLYYGLADFARGNLSIQARSLAPILDDKTPDEIGQLAQLHNQVVKQITDGIQDFNSITFMPCDRLFYVGTDLYLGGQRCGEMMGELLHGQGEVAIFMKKISVQSNNLRRKGFTNGLTRKYPNIKIVEVNEDNEDIEANYRMTKELIKKYPNLNGVYITIGNTPVGTARAVEEAGKKGLIKIVCHDLVDTTMQYIEKDVISATLSDSVFAQAYDPIIRLHNFMVTGERSSFDQYLSILEIVTKKNYKEFWHPEKGILISDQVAQNLVVPLPAASNTKRRIAVILPSKELYWKTVYDGSMAAKDALLNQNTEVDIFIPEVLLKGDWRAQSLVPTIQKIYESGYQALALPIFDENLIPYLNSRIESGLNVATFLCEPTNLRGMLKGVSSHAGHLASTSVSLTDAATESKKFILQLNQTMSTVNTSMEKLHVSLDGTKSILEDLNEKTEKANSQTSESMSAARETKAKANTGFETVRKNRDAMKALKTSSQKTTSSIETLNAYTMKIKKIVSIIDDIAEKTNILAINAAIQASRAGEAGKGFGVVANEIKTLSLESKTATSEISDLIQSILEGIANTSKLVEESVNAVNENVALTENAGTALEEIINASSSNEEKTQKMFVIFEEMRTLSEGMKNSMQSWMSENETNRAEVRRITGDAQTMNEQIIGINRMVDELSEMARSQKDTLAQFVI